MRTQRTLGAPLAGLLQDYVVVPAEDAVAAPAHLRFIATDEARSGAPGHRQHLDLEL
jgi:hypothetical protein